LQYNFLAGSLLVSAVVVPLPGFAPAVESVAPVAEVGALEVVTWATVWLTACWTGAEAAACCAVVVVLEAHPAKSGVSAHWVAVGTTLQPASEESAVH
jgi:hypothetical protein